jgi:hypothetical protein
VERFAFAVLISLVAMVAHAGPKASIGLAVTGNKNVEVCSGEPVDTTCEDTATGYRISLAYQFHENFAAEVAHDDFGKIEADFNGYYRIETTSMSGRATGAYLKGRLPLGERAKLTGKLGMASWEGEFDEVWDDPRFPGAPGAHLETHASDSGSTAVAGIGIAIGWVELGLAKFFDVADEDLTQLSLGVNIPLGR